MTTALSVISPTPGQSYKCRSGVQYNADVVTGICTLNSAGGAMTAEDWTDLIRGGCWPNGDPPGLLQAFGGSGQFVAGEGNLYRAAGNPVGANAADTTDDILGGFQLAAGAFDQPGRGLAITVQGMTAANGNNKQMKLWLNPTMAGQTISAAGVISGGTVSGVGAGVTLLASGVQTLNAKGWALMGNLFKFGAAGSNTQYFQGSTIMDTTHGGLLAALFPTQNEAAVMNIVVTGASSTTGAASDVKMDFIEINAMN